jgi:RimJ/RimL family protein N-acetyltransferase
LPPIAEDLIFIEEYKSRITLKNGKSMLVRPLLPSDEIAYRNFFYSLKRETVYMRFFHVVAIFSRKMAQDHWAAMDYRKTISIIGIVQDKGNQEIIAIGNYAKMDDDDWAEVAFVVRDDYQSQGVSTHLMKQLQKVAVANGLKGFFATMLAENKPMQSLCRKLFPDARIKLESGEVEVWMPFAS